MYVCMYISIYTEATITKLRTQIKELENSTEQRATVSNIIILL